LNQHGCGTIGSIVSGLSRFWDYLQKNYGDKLDQIPVVINASLRFHTPVAIHSKRLHDSKLLTKEDQEDLKMLKNDPLYLAHPNVGNVTAEGFADFIWQSLDVMRILLFASNQVPGGILRFWRDDSTEGMKAPPDKPRRLLIAAAGNDHEQGN